MWLCACMVNGRVSWKKSLGQVVYSLASRGLLPKSGFCCGLNLIHFCKLSSFTHPNPIKFEELALEINWISRNNLEKVNPFAFWNFLNSKKVVEIFWKRESNSGHSKIHSWGASTGEFNVDWDQAREDLTHSGLKSVWGGSAGFQSGSTCFFG